MKKIEFQSYLDCLYGGVQRRFFSNVVEIEVKEDRKIPPKRMSIKIPREEQKCPKIQTCQNVDLLIAFLFFSCL